MPRARPPVLVLGKLGRDTRACWAPSMVGSRRTRRLVAWRSAGDPHPLVDGFASFVIDTDGTGRIGVWGSTVPVPGEQVSSVRQNLPP